MQEPFQSKSDKEIINLITYYQLKVVIGVYLFGFITVIYVC